MPSGDEMTSGESKLLNELNTALRSKSKKKGGMVKRKYGGKVKRNMGGLVGGQTKLDMNKDGRITKQDFKMMPKKKKMGGGKVFRRGGGQALRGFGKATYSNKMY